MTRMRSFLPLPRPLPGTLAVALCGLFAAPVLAAPTSQVVTIDGQPTGALTGERLSPISSELAPVIAQQYVRLPAPVTAVEIERYTPRKKKRAQDAVRVRFDNADATEIVLDRQTGEILEDEGRWRRVHFAVMQLHQLNFFGFEKTLLNIPGVPILLMSLSGCLLWIFHRARKRRSQSGISARETALFPARSTGEPKEVPPLS